MIRRLPARHVALLAALAGALWFAACGWGFRERKIRVVVVTLDTLRNDCFAGSAGRAPVMPLTREFAARGQIFENYFAANSMTQPTHASLFTGLHPWQHGVTRNGGILDESFLTIAERMKQEGFETGAVVASFPLHGKFGFAQGFDEYRQDFDLNLADIGLWEGVALEGPNFYSRADAVTERALDLLDRSHGDRQFFWFHYFDPHEPYGDTTKKKISLNFLNGVAAYGHPLARQKVEEARQLYDRDVSFLDLSLARLLLRLSEDEDDYETHVVVSSDHGESFGEDGTLGHGSRVTREQIHVPLFIVSPALEPGIRRDVTGSVDLTATILSLAGFDPEVIRGRDLTKPVSESGGSAFGMRRTFATPFVDARLEGPSVTLDGLRFFTVRDGVIYTGNSTEVVEEDLPGREVGADLSRTLQALFRTFEEELSGVSTREVLDEEDLEILKSLGYVQ